MYTVVNSTIRPRRKESHSRLRMATRRHIVLVMSHDLFLISRDQREYASLAPPRRRTPPASQSPLRNRSKQEL
ncbi:hypothetical protein EVAR_38861_1 [Eumeta japonica]|uniref:Uncharacterized protein n=1 Tax=Eumeta variegata TaxID=151549 RepID=A0A4C1X6V8_EUMVA|nr:hypothetical protein EVAR_38861_1 [Eumeta japonica]